jgi:transposase
VVVCVRVPDPGGRALRAQEVRTFSTLTWGLQQCADWLHDWAVTRVVMESTGDYWKAPFWLLEAAGFEVWLVNARDVKHLPGRAKTDKIDAVWLCKLAERGMLRPSFVPPLDIRQLRQLTRYRANLVHDRTREKNRVEKVLDQTGVKLSVVISDLFGVSGRDMLAALVRGERDPQVLADLARGRMRAKNAGLVQALHGLFFTEHDAFVLSRMLARIDAINTDITAVEERIDELIAPFGDAVTRLCTIPGVGPSTAIAILAETGRDMSRFPTPQHLASWAKVSPQANESAGKTRGSRSTGKGNSYLAGALGLAVLGCCRTDTFLGARYRRLVKRRGKSRAVVAISRSMLTAVWHILSQPGTTYLDLGPDHYDHTRNHDRALRNAIQRLNALGYRVTLEAA